MSRDMLMTLASLLGYGVLIGMGILLYSCLMMLIFPGVAYSVTAYFVPISVADYHLIYVVSLAFFKLLWLVFFVMPYIAIKIYLRV